MKYTGTYIHKPNVQRYLEDVTQIALNAFWDKVTGTEDDQVLEGEAIPETTQEFFNSAFEAISNYSLSPM